MPNSSSPNGLVRSGRVCVARFRSQRGRSRILERMAAPRDERLTPARIASHLMVMLAVAAILGVVVAGLAIPFAGVLGLGARNAARAMDNLPAELETDPLPQRTRLVDASGKTVATFYDENRVNVHLDEISRTMLQAIVAIEDDRF